jgi:hypothetical protein
MNHIFMQILNHAMQNVNAELKLKQERILHKEKFGNDAVMHPDYFKAGDEKNSELLWNDLEEKYKEQLEFAKKLQSFITKANDDRFDDILRDYFKDKK